MTDPALPPASLPPSTTKTTGHAPSRIRSWVDQAPLDATVRALAAAGPSIPAIETVGYDAFCDALRDVIAPFVTHGVGIRITSELGWITADATC